MSHSLEKIASLIGGKISQKALVEITSLYSDSRQVTPGSLFVAIQGNSGDGAQYVEQAIKRGALAIVSQVDVACSVPVIKVPDARIALSKLAALFEGEPAKKLVMIGVTGTNGKTTSTYLIEGLLEKLKSPVLRIGTTGNRLRGVLEQPGILTTPDPITLHQLCAQALNSQAYGACLEVSSHALDQHRADDLDFSCAVFTNLTRDHLDYHQTLENYHKAKFKLFELLLKSTKTNPGAVINIDDQAGQEYATWCVKQSRIRLCTFGRNSSATIRLLDFSQSLEGMKIKLNISGTQYNIHSPLLGEFNAENIMAALGALTVLGWKVSDVVPLFSTTNGAPGRLERFEGSGKTCFVDYAHSPDALERTLKTLRPLCFGKLWVIFGCGGDRDKGKRPIMGQIAAEFADCVVVTSDNPRTEDPQSIINDILAGGIKAAVVDVDRRAAIRKTVNAMSAGDVLLLAGKGHEDYQIIGTEKQHFSDQEELRAIL